MPSWSGSALKKRGIPFVVAGNSNCRQSAVSATVVKPFGFATGDWEGSRCGIRTRIALQNPVAQVVVAILWGHGPFATPGQGGCSLGMHGSPPKRREKKARRSTAGRPSTTFWAAETQFLGGGNPTHCVRSRLRRMQAPQRSSETTRLACKIVPICLIPLVRKMPGALRPVVVQRSIKVLHGQPGRGSWASGGCDLRS